MCVVIDNRNAMHLHPWHYAEHLRLREVQVSVRAAQCLQDIAFLVGDTP